MSPRSRAYFLLPLLIAAGWSVSSACAAQQPSAAQSTAAQAPAQAPKPAAPSKPVDLGLTPEQAQRKGPDGISYGEAVRRALIYSAGANHVQQIEVKLMLQAEIERRQTAGEVVPDLRVPDEEIELQLQKKMEEVGGQPNPSGLGFWDQLDLLGFTPQSYKENVLMTNLVLDRLFFPSDPEQWPVPLLQRIFEAGTEQSMWDAQLKGVYEQALQAKQEGKEYAIDEFMRQLVMRGPVLRWLIKTVPITEPFQGLPEGTALRVGSHSMSTDELLALCSMTVGPVELQRAKDWVDLTWKVQDELAKRKVLLSVPEAMDLMAAEMKEYEGSILTYEQVALQFLGFPTMDLYRTWFRLRQSLRKSLPDPYPVDMMQQELAGHASFLTGSQVDADIILLSARDTQTGLYPRTGDPFGAAAARAEQAKQKLAAGAEWDAVLSEFSDFPDSYPNTVAGVPQPHRGRLGPLELNVLREFLGENEYLEFVTGSDLSSQIFFEAERGAVYGPVRGSIGYILFRVNDRVPGQREIFLQEVDGKATEEVVVRHRYLVGDDLLSERFRMFVNEVMAAK